MGATKASLRLDTRFVLRKPTGAPISVFWSSLVLGQQRKIKPKLVQASKGCRNPHVTMGLSLNQPRTWVFSIWFPFELQEGFPKKPRAGNSKVNTCFFSEGATSYPKRRGFGVGNSAAGTGVCVKWGPQAWWTSFCFQPPN